MPYIHIGKQSDEPRLMEATVSFVTGFAIRGLPHTFTR